MKNQNPYASPITNRHCTQHHLAQLVTFGLVILISFSGCQRISAALSKPNNHPNNADSTIIVPNLSTASFELNSAGVSNGTLSRQHTCDGASTSPPLTWGSPPSGTQSFAVVMHHVPGPGDTHWYWVNYQIPADTRSLSEGTRIGIFGNNSVNGKTEYAPPCSKGPGAKTYTITIYALAAAPDIRVAANQVSREVLLAAIKDRTLAQATIDVVYSR